MSVTPNTDCNTPITDYSTSVTGTAATVVTAAEQKDNLRFLMIANNSASGTLWVSHSTTATVGGTGSYAIGPATKQIYTSPGPIPLTSNGISAISNTGTINATIYLG